MMSSFTCPTFRSLSGKLYNKIVFYCQNENKKIQTLIETLTFKVFHGQGRSISGGARDQCFQLIFLYTFEVITNISSG